MKIDVDDESAGSEPAPLVMPRLRPPASAPGPTGFEPWPEASPRLDGSLPLDLGLAAVERLAVSTAHPQAETAIAWHRKGFRRYWSWKRWRREGRQPIGPEVRNLIRQMSLANPRWGAPRIHGELLKIGIELSQATVVKQHGPASQASLADEHQEIHISLLYDDAICHVRSEWLTVEDQLLRQKLSDSLLWPPPRTAESSQIG